jgi:hypothetical protein
MCKRSEIKSKVSVTKQLLQAQNASQSKKLNGIQSSEEAESRSASEEISCYVSMEPEYHYYVHMSPPIVLIRVK